MFKLSNPRMKESPKVGGLKEQAMTTPVMMPTIVILLQLYPGGGSAIPTPRQGNSAVMSTFFTMDDCNRDRYARGHPEDFYCLEYRSEKIINTTSRGIKVKASSTVRAR
jgi:hypothetical protein